MTLADNSTGTVATGGTNLPAVSIVIVSYNSRPDLERCLPGLYAQDVSGEIIVADNCSTNGTALWVRRHHPRVRLLALDQNDGYGAASNRGIDLARGSIVLIMNPDTVMHPGTLAELLRVLEEHPRAFVTPILLRPDGSVNTCGNRMHYTGIATCVGLGDNAEAYSGIHYPFALSGAAIMARKEAWLDLGGFDERFFLYLEDTDLSLRARLKGCAIVCASDARVTHDYKLNMHPTKFYLLERNRLLMVLKIYQRTTFQQILPALLLTELLTWTFASVKGPPYLVARWRGYVWLWRHRREWLSDRASIQATRQISDAELLSGTTTVLPFRQLVRWPRLAGALERALTPIYRRFWPCGEDAHAGVLDRRRHAEHPIHAT